MKFELVIPVWGAKHVNIFVTEVVPSLLSPGNLLAPDLDAEIIFEIYTTDADKRIIEASASYQQLKKVIHVNFNIFPVDAIEKLNSYRLMTRCHREAFIKSNFEVPLIHLGADSVCSDGFIRHIVHLAKTGIRAVFSPIVRVLKDEFSPAIDDYVQKKALTYRSLPPRELVRMGLNTLHPYAKTLMYNKEFINVLIAHLYWPLNDKGLLIRGFHLHPFLIWPEKKILPPRSSTVDDKYLEMVCPSRNKWKFIEDSDDFVVFEVTENDINASFLMPKNIDHLETYVRKVNMHAFHYEMFKKKFFFRTTDDSADWIKIMKDSDLLVDELLKKVSKNNFRQISFKTFKFLRNVLKEHYYRFYKPKIKIKHNA